MSRLQLAAHTFGLAWDHDAPTAVDILADKGFTAFEVLAMPPHFDPYALDGVGAAQLRRTAEKAGGGILALDLPSNDVNIGSTAPEVVAFSVRCYQATLRAAANAGAEAVVVLPGRRHGLLPPPDFRLVDVVRQAFERIVTTANDLGLWLLLENHPQCLIADVPGLVSFIEDGGYPNVGIVYDVANALASGKDPAGGIAEAGHHLKLVHLSDSIAAGWRHDPIGSGDIDFAAVNRAVVAAAYKGPVVVEIIAAAAADHLAAARDALTRQGWAFDR